MRPNKEKVDEQLVSLRTKYLNNQKILKSLQETYIKWSDDLLRVDEKIARLETGIQQDMIEVRKNDKKITKLKEDIEERKTINLPEKNQIRDLSGLVKASKSIFSSSAFAKEDRLSAKRNISLLGKPGEILLEIANISEKVVNLKKNIVDLKRAQIELSEVDGAVKKIKELDYLRSEKEKFQEKTVLVKFTNLLGEEDSCYFPIVNNDGYQITFSELLNNASRYWNLFGQGCVLVDKEYTVWPGTAIVEDEAKNSNREIWIMTKEEAHYYKVKGNIEEGKERIPDEAESESEADNEEDKVHYDEDWETKLKEKEEALKADKERNMGLLRIERLRHMNVLNLLVYMLFIVLFTWNINEWKNTTTFYYTRLGIINFLLMYPFPVNSSNFMTFSSIQLPSDLESYLTGTFVSGIWQDTKYNNDPMTKNELNYVAYVYKLVGPIRVVQKRVKTNSCSHSMYKIIGRSDTSCYSDYSDSVEDTSPIVINDASVSSVDSSWLKYTHDSGARTVTGERLSYQLEGYMAYIRSNLTMDEAQKNISFIISDWINYQTRLLAFNINLCNNFADVCSSVDLLFEFTASGLVLPKAYVYVYRVYVNWTSSDIVRNAFEGVIGIIMLYFIIDLIWRVRKEGWKLTFLSFWTAVRILLIIMLIIKVTLLIAYSQRDEVLNFQSINDEFVDYEKLGYFFNTTNNFIGVTSFVAFFFILSFLQQSKSMKIIWGTLRESLRRLVFFFSVFILIMTGWLLLAYRGFGQYSIEYKDYGTTLNTLLQMLFGNIDFDTIWQIQPVFASIFFVLFIFLTFFVMLNIFLAIINESYDTYYKKFSTDDKKDEILIIFGLIFNAIKYGLFVYPYKFVTCQKLKREKLRMNEIDNDAYSAADNSTSRDNVSERSITRKYSL
ncbi:unnamed protein product [Blepharisma stoltei]|uniref:Uncharacterized protein n=1 Tax=Blepharisma stoltei TaxID=1481888 RepID=A0AAU9IGG9_9CILI|nr:unnamed protein product [Blepharisma stoltei]